MKCTLFLTLMACIAGQSQLQAFQCFKQKAKESKKQLQASCSSSQLYKLQPVTFNANGEEHSGNKNQYSLIWEELNLGLGDTREEQLEKWDENNSLDNQPEKFLKNPSEINAWLSMLERLKQEKSDLKIAKITNETQNQKDKK